MQNIQSMKQSVQKGFTLIELMIVVAIIGILAAIAIPAYQDYTIKSRISEGASLSGAFKTAIEVYWSENGTLGGVTTAELGTTSVSGEYVSTIDLIIAANRPELEVILRTDTNKIGDENGSCFRYVPTPTNGVGSNLRWTVEVDVVGCGTPVTAKYLPKT